MIFFVHALVYIVYTAYVYIYTHLAAEQKPAVSIYPYSGYARMCVYVCLYICVHAHMCMYICLCVRETDAL